MACGCKAAAGRASVAAALLVFGAHIPVSAGACTVFSSATEPPVPPRAVTIDDLAQLRDIGRGDTGGDQGPSLGVSPDGRFVATVVRRSDPMRNSYCQAMVVIATDGAALARITELDAAPIRFSFDLRGLLTPTGAFIGNQPRWSPDGRTIAILKRDGDIAQVWAMNLSGSEGKFLTKAAADVEEFAWSPDGLSVVYASRPGVPAYRAAVAREALEGYHYDARISPLMSIHPMVPASIAAAYRTTELGSGRDRSATAAERALVDRAQIAGRPADATEYSRAEDGRSAWTAPRTPDRWLSPMTLTASDGNAKTVCKQAACTGRLEALWWHKGAVIYLRREGWGESMTAIYRWRPGSAPRRLLRTADALIGCQLAGERLVCGREGSTQPRRLWSLNLMTHAERTLFNLNPEFASLRRPKVERLHWRGSHGSQGYGDLVVPEGDPGPTGFPLIIVQYRTRGFLRGGIGLEYPIFPFAAHGFAVLSIENAKPYAVLVEDDAARTVADAERVATANDNERRLQLVNLEAGIAAARDRAPIDMTRLGITGVSDGASSAVFALLNTKLFSAAAIGSPTLDPSMLALGGPAIQAEFSDSGYPPTAGNHDAFYRSNALLANADRIRVPILFQWPEDEYLGGLTAMTALQEASAPVDLYLFPGETHVKWQPAHRLALYRRNLAWFEFWFGTRSPELEASQPYPRWRELRDQLCASAVPPGAPIQLCSHASTSTNSVSRK